MSTCVAAEQEPVVFVQRRPDLANEIPRRLVRAASEMFARHGYAAARVREIVRVADVDLSAVQYYFGGKEGLYAATLKELAAAEPAAPSPAAENAEEELYREVLQILRRLVGTESSPLGRIIAYESMNPTECFEQLVGDTLKPQIERLSAIVKRLAGDGADDATIARVAMSVMGQCLFYLFARGAIDRMYPGVRKDAESLARHITGFSLMGIAVHTTRSA